MARPGRGRRSRAGRRRVSTCSFSSRIGRLGMFSAACDGARGHPPDGVGVRAQVLDPLLGAAQPRGGDHLHRARDLADVLDRADAAADVLQGGHLGSARRRSPASLTCSSSPASSRRASWLGSAPSPPSRGLLAAVVPGAVLLPRSSFERMRSDSPSSIGLPSASKSGPKSSIASAMALPSRYSIESSQLPSAICSIRSASSECSRWSIISWNSLIRSTLMRSR